MELADWASKIRELMSDCRLRLCVGKGWGVRGDGGREIREDFL